MKFVLATRGSPLALWQAHETRRLLLARHPDWDVVLLPVQSAGDKDSKTELARFGLTGIFTAEVDHAVVSEKAHAGVHSLKDMTTSLHERLTLAACLARGPAEDVLLTTDRRCLADLPAGARVATGSVRRVAMIRRLRPDLELVGIRGNVETRLRKLADGEAEALVMARAGLERLGLTDHISEVFDVERSVPAVGQGIVGITCRVEDSDTIAALTGIAHAASFAAARAERALLHALHGGCNAPVGGHATCSGVELALHARVLALDGRECVEDRITGHMDHASQLGETLARRLNERGAKRLIDAARES
ncbi:MAG: hydroxymethylbilane synthase [Planctomycetes bacterium]|nr:hydroxymethylbilane synthase [Planctomycetota bacterium]